MKSHKSHNSTYTALESRSESIAVGLIEDVVAHFASSDELDTQTLKAMIGASRRTAMPLMALLDELQITRRDGSLRRLIGSEPKW